MVNKGSTMKKQDIIIKTSTIVFYIIATISIIMIIMKLTGHSPTIEEIILSFVGVNTVAIFALFSKIIKTESDIGQLKGELKHLNKKVDSIGHDLKLHLAKK